MKKVLCLFILFLILLICGCSNYLDSVVLNNMSDLRVNYFEGKTEQVFASLSCGQREQNFAYDGISNNPISCAVLTVGYFNAQFYSKIEVVILINGVEKNVNK